MAIILFCALVIAVGLELYSSWSLNKTMKEFFQSSREKLL